MEHWEKQSALCETDKGKLFRKMDRKQESHTDMGRERTERITQTNIKVLSLKKKKKRRRDREEWNFAE